jgi:predicted anti-sigma-YlaC factor YlaD
MGQLSSNDCAHLREQLSAALDGELSPFERARVDAHLAVCGACREYATVTADAARLLRATPLEEISVPFVLPSRRLALARKVQVGAAAATLLAAVGLASVAGNVGPSSPSPQHNNTSTAKKLRFPEQELRMLQRASQARTHVRTAL